MSIYLFLGGIVALGIVIDRLEKQLKNIVEATVALQSDVEAARSHLDSMASDLTVLRNRLAPKQEYF